jgi:hypothetical protein
MEQDLPAYGPTGRGHKAQDRQGSHAFAATTLTNQAQCLLSLDRETDTVYSFENPFVHVKVGFEVPYLQEGAL